MTDNSFLNFRRTPYIFQISTIINSQFLQFSINFRSKKDSHIQYLLNNFINLQHENKKFKYKILSTYLLLNAVFQTRYLVIRKIIFLNNVFPFVWNIKVFKDYQILVNVCICSLILKIFFWKSLSISNLFLQRVVKYSCYHYFPYCRKSSCWCTNTGRCRFQHSFCFHSLVSFFKFGTRRWYNIFFVYSNWRHDNDLFFCFDCFPYRLLFLSLTTVLV